MSTSDGKTEMTQVPIECVDAILLRPHEEDEPGIFFWLADGTTILRVFSDDKDCNDVWTVFCDSLPSNSFVRYHNVFFRPESLEKVERTIIDGIGHIRFQIRNEKSFLQRYPDETTLERDLTLVTEILCALQDVRAREAGPRTTQ